MKLKEKIRRVRVPMYDFMIVDVVFTTDMRASEKKREVLDIGQAHTLGADNHIVVLLPTRSPAWLAAHEAVHVATYVLQRAGVRASLSNDEPIAYIVDWFTRWVLEQR